MSSRRGRGGRGVLRPFAGGGLAATFSFIFAPATVYFSAARSLPLPPTLLPFPPLLLLLLLCFLLCFFVMFCVFTLFFVGGSDNELMFLIDEEIWVAIRTNGTGEQRERERE